MKPRAANSSSSSRPEHGAALIVTLLVLVLFVVIVTGFLSTTRVEQMASRNFSFQNQARQMAMLGIQRAIAQLNVVGTNMATATNVASQPGRIIVDGATTLLSSAALTGVSSSNVNLNESRVIHTNNNPDLFRAPLFNVTNSAGQTNGRYAFWIDDEGSKANLNAMLPSPRSSFVPTNNRSFDYSAVGSAGQSNFGAVISNSVSNNWPFFFSGNQIGLLSGVGAATARQYLHFMAGGAPNLTSLPRFMTNGRVNLNTFMAPVTNGAVVFQRNFLSNAAAAAVLSEIDAVISNNIDRAAVTNRFGSSFTGKYTQNVLRQIVANINDWPLAAGTTESPGQTGVTGAASLDSDGIPGNVFGLRRLLHLNEVAAQSVYVTNASGVDAQIWITVEFCNPYDVAWGDAAEIVVELDRCTFSGSYISGGSTNLLAELAVASSTFRTNFLPPGVNLSPRSYTNITLAITTNYPMAVAFSNVIMTNLVAIKAVKLLQWASQPLSIRDWAAGVDFPASGWRFTNTNAASVVASPPATVRGFTTNIPSYVSWGASPSLQGIAKNDPRVRTFSTWSSPSPAWIAVGSAGAPVTIGSNNSVVNYSAGTGLANIANDPVPSGLASIFNHPSFQSAFTAQNANESYRSVMDLGRVHTGLQWRTLQMRSQNAGEPGPPDWALLEAFLIPNNLPRINVNSLQQQATTGVMSNAAAQLANGLPRILSLASLFSGGSAANATAAGMSGSSAFGSGVNSALSVATNVAAMNFRTNWANRRSTNTAFYSNAYGLIGEVLEISNVADFSATDDFINEGRAAAFIDALSTSSDVFAIYSVGFGVDGAGENVAEYRARAIVRLDQTTGKFRVELIEPLVLP